jgi:uncharacterized protein DUF1236
MKRYVIAAATAVAILGTGQAWAQSTVVIEPEQRAKIKEYVVQERIRPTTMRERVVVGATVPDGVDLVAVPDTWGSGMSRYRYVYSNDHVLLVEPSSRKVIQIIE